jgi:hypothetical protein
MRFLFLASVLASAACGHGLDAQVTGAHTSGLGVTYKYLAAAQWDATAIDELEERLVECVSSVPGYSRHAMLHSLGVSVVYVSPGAFACMSSPSGLCNGEQDGPDIVVREIGSPASSALRFELARWLEQDIKGITDYSLDRIPSEEPIEPQLWTCT